MNAYSRLKRLLKQQRISVPELQRRMRSQGLHINVKSLYRLSKDNQPVDRLDMRVAGAICRICAVPLSEWIVFEEETDSLRSFAPEQQRRLDALMERNNAGTLNEQQRDELQTLVREAEQITVTNTRLLAQQRQRLESATGREHRESLQSAYTHRITRRRDAANTAARRRMPAVIISTLKTSFRWRREVLTMNPTGR